MTAANNPPTGLKSQITDRKLYVSCYFAKKINK